MTHFYQVIEEQTVPTGSPWRLLLHRVIRFASGRIVNYDLKVEGAAVCIVAQTVNCQILLVEQFRPGPGRRLREIPGGCVDPGEELLAAATRELLEETGHVGDLEYVGQALVCAYSTGVRHVFVAKNCVQVMELVGVGIEVGDIELVYMTLAEFHAHLQNGQLTDVQAGYRALDHLGYLRPTV